MTKILTIAGKELYSTLVNRNLILIMFLTPLVLSSIMALAFGGLGDAGSSVFSDIPVAVVNRDEGFDLGAQLGAGAAITDTSLDALEFTISDTVINVGELLRQNPNVNLSDADLDASNVDFNMGELLANILVSQPLTETEAVTESGTTSATGFAGTSFADLSCPLSDAAGGDSVFSGDATLDDLFAAEAVADPAAARAGVEDGTYAAAVIIPPDFSNRLMPLFNFGEGSSAGTLTGTQTLTDTSPALVEVYGNTGQSIAATIVSAVVEGIVNQLMRTGVALEAVVNTGVNSLADVELSSLDTIDPALITGILTGGLPTVDAAMNVSVLEPLACLVLPGAGAITLRQQPLDPLQERSGFAIVMVILGSAQAIFFALFTGVFGINSIYEDRDQGTLQRVLVSPTPSSFILAGKLLGNVVVVTLQLLVLFLSFTLLTSLVEMQPVFIFGNNVFLFLLLVIAISLFASGLGVMLVGVANTTQQVQLIGPMLVTLLGALGGSFGFRLPSEVARISPIWWASEGLYQLAIGEPNIGLHLLVLFSLSALLFGIGTILFRRRLGL